MPFNKVFSVSLLTIFESFFLDFFVKTDSLVCRLSPEFDSFNIFTFWRRKKCVVDLIRNPTKSDLCIIFWVNFLFTFAENDSIFQCNFCPLFLWVIFRFYFIKVVESFSLDSFRIKQQVHRCNWKVFEAEEKHSISLDPWKYELCGIMNTNSHYN